MGKRALITGIVGQDGSYLAKLLLERGTRSGVGDRRGGDGSCRFKELGIERDVDVVSMDLLEFTNIYKIIEKVEPDEVYNLAAQSFVQASFEIPIMTVDVNALGALRLLEVLRCLRPGAKFYQASTSEMFGNTRETPQTEETPFYPRSPYGAAKLFAHWITVNHRESYGMFACSRPLSPPSVCRNRLPPPPFRRIPAPSGPLPSPGHNRPPRPAVTSTICLLRIPARTPSLSWHPRLPNKSLSCNPYFTLANP